MGTSDLKLFGHSAIEVLGLSGLVLAALRIGANSVEMIELVVVTSPEVREQDRDRVENRVRPSTRYTDVRLAIAAQVRATERTRELASSRIADPV
jgi:hypothetical protein